MRLTRPISATEARAYRAAGFWADAVPADLQTFRANGPRVALVDRSGTHTYDELASAAARVAGALQSFGVRTGDAVVIVTDNDCGSVIACHATWLVGAVAVLVHRSSGAADVEFACCAAAPAAVLASSSGSPLVATLDRKTWAVHNIADICADNDWSAPDLAPVDPDAPRLIIFTSGTTSTPKGVVHTANTLRAAAANYVAMADLTADDRFFLVSPLASIAGVAQALLVAPSLGMATVLENAWHAESTLDFLRETGGTFYGGTDNVLARLFDTARSHRVTVPLRSVAVGGTMLRRDVLDDAESSFGIQVLRVYGSSEAPSSTGTRPDDPRELRVFDDGMPAPGVEVRVVEDGSHEVQVRGPHLFRGYLDEADNEGAFDGDWFRTGDAADLSDGRLRVVGRLKEIANRNGKKISLAEVEQAFLAQAKVESCAAFVMPDPLTGERVALAVRGAALEALDVPGLLDAMVAAGLAKWKLPESVVLFEAQLPMTATGKVRRSELAESAGDVLWQAARLR